VIIDGRAPLIERINPAGMMA